MLVAIAGNIGAGKSSLTALLHEHFGWKPIFEPLMENPYLREFYRDMAGCAYQSQLYFLAMHCAALRAHPRGKEILVQDRSVYEDAEIFTAMLYDLGYIDARDYATYEILYRGIREHLPPPAVMFYLRVDVDALMENIRARGRDFEQTIERSYIEHLNRRYDAWAESFDQCPLHILEAGTFEFLYDTQAREEMLYTINRFIHQ